MHGDATIDGRLGASWFVQQPRSASSCVHLSPFLEIILSKPQCTSCDFACCSFALFDELANYTLMYSRTYVRAHFALPFYFLFLWQYDQAGKPAADHFGVFFAGFAERLLRGLYARNSRRTLCRSEAWVVPQVCGVFVRVVSYFSVTCPCIRHATPCHGTDFVASYSRECLCLYVIILGYLRREYTRKDISCGFETAKSSALFGSKCGAARGLIFLFDLSHFN